MRCFLIIAVSFCCLVQANSQDLIVTGKGDSLNCKITKIKSDFIHFTFKFENEIRNTLLPVEKIKYYKRDFYAEPEVPIEKVKDVSGDYKKIKIGGYGGLSFRTAKVSENAPDDFEQYLNELKSGFHFGGDFYYFFSENIGVGFKYSMYHSTNSIDNIYIDDGNGQGRTGQLRDKITIHYFGPAVSATFGASEKALLFTNFSMGYLSYKDKATIITDFTLSGGTLGLVFDFGVDVPVDKNLSVVFVCGFTLGTLNQFKYKDATQSMTIKLDKENYESLTRIDLSVGLRFSK